MKKIGIITMIGNNFGNRLQNYALQESLKKLNWSPETIYNYVYEVPKTKTSFLDIPKKIYHKIKFTILKKKYQARENRRTKLFDEFNKKYINFSKEKILSKDFEFDELNSKFDKFVVGSDQVWNPYAHRNKYIDFLEFSPKEKNITYAVSFGIDKLESKFQKIYEKGLNNFSYISVREDKGKEIAELLTKRNDIEVLVDPTMLLSKEEWMKIEAKPKQLKNKKYILNYFLGKVSKERKKEIKRIAKENDCEIINILDKKDPFYESGPSEFLYLERNAFLICTDSFHSCVFAILFNVTFIVFDREDKLVKMNSRLETLLKKFALEDRKYTGKVKQNELSCNYEKSIKILEEEKKKSYIFLKEALNKDI